MTTNRQYKCNICREQINEDDKPGIGVVKAGETIEERPLHKAETHICRYCMAAIGAMYSSILRGEAPHNEAS